MSTPRDRPGPGGAAAGLSARLRTLRPTGRGSVLAVSGVALAALGVGIGVPALVQAGLLAVLAVLAGAATVVADVAGPHRRALRVTRTVHPHPVTVDETATVTIEVTGRAGLDRARLSERAARELSGGRPLRAKVTRSANRVQLRYSITPARRGRWSAGPLQIHLRDVLGTVRWSGELGSTRQVAVRPRVTPLHSAGGSASLDTRAALGSRSPSPDDTALRDYRPGDDPRRVHWRSTARRGELVVRQDERAGRRPATVLLDLPAQDEPLEWTIAAGVSVAISLLESGHRVRMLAGARLPDRHRSDELAAEAMLDQAVDLVAPPDPVTGRRWLLAAIGDLTARGAGSELVVAILGASDPYAQADLARIAAVHDAWAMVRTGDETTLPEERTLQALRRAGWTASLARTGEPVRTAWQRLRATGDLALGAHR
ncbi:DUF58 domain-containing protein [Isoptericola sp. b490]|uniref:DUF58 domain-containing protein n=1 Tax=Actinotalea lenta TaxID=3064654 RepID=UPI002714300D|nr:DUF58 domain-containing protein [Isoptericola sp. b490]MDO8120920.1 DUF58 domain-containing protein [Isoptericola sp. b490]